MLCVLCLSYVAAAAADQPVARALHTMTNVAQHVIVVGGQSSLGPLSNVGMMCSPAVLHTQQLQQQVVLQQQQLLQGQLERLGLQAEMQDCRAKLQCAQASNQVGC